MRALLVSAASLALAVAAAGCNSDPCGAFSAGSGTCITLHVLAGNNVTQLQQLDVLSQVDTQAQEFKQSPLTPNGTTYNLPFDIALLYPAGLSGTVQLAVGAVTSDNLTAVGGTRFPLVAGQRKTVNVTLDMAPQPITANDMAIGKDMATTPDMGPVLNGVISGSFDWFSASASVIAAVTHSNQTLQIYDYPSGQLRATLDTGVDAHSLYVSDSVVLYCASPVTIGATANKSCTLKMWKPGDTSGTMLGTGVYPFLPRVSSDGTVMGWTENVDATATKADVVSWFSGTKTTLGMQMPLVNAGGLIYNNVGYVLVPSATAGQFDIVRTPAAATIVHICVNCDQLVMKNDGSQIAARSTPVANLGKLVVAPSSTNTVNGLGMSAMGSGATSDVSSLIDYFDSGSVMYFSASGAANNIREWTAASNLVTTRLSDGSAKGVWGDNGSFLAFYKTIDGNGVGDLWLLPSLNGSAVLFDTGGKLYDLTSDGRFTFTKEPSTASSTWYVEVGSGVSNTPLATFKAPSGNGRIVNATRVAFYSESNTYALADYNSGVGFSWTGVFETFTSLPLSRILFLFQGTSSDGIYVYAY